MARETAIALRTAHGEAAALAMAGERIQTACNAMERRHWSAVQAALITLQAEALTAFRAAVDAEMQRVYGVTWADASGDNDMLARHRADGEDAVTFVRWFGEKYDLEPRGRAYGW